MKKIAWGIVVIIVIVLIVLSVKGGEKNYQTVTNDTFKIGAILPLSGVTAVWGEQLQAGMELALEDLGENASNVELLIEDSQASPTEGVSAYNKLVDTDNADAVISAFSRVSVPITKLVQEDEVPLFVTLVSSMDAVSEENPWVFRLFSNTHNAANVYFPAYESLGVKKLGVLTLNDEYGVSMTNQIKELAATADIEIVDFSYLPGDLDYRTQLTKIKESNPDAINFIGIPPIALTNVLRQSKELEMDIPFFEASALLQNQNTIESLEGLAEGAYSFAGKFSLYMRGQGVYDRYLEKYGSPPHYAVSYGYDVVKLISEVSENGLYRGQDLIDRLQLLQTFDGIDSQYTLDGRGEIMPEIFPIQIINGESVIVE